MGENIVKTKSFEFALKIISLYKLLVEERGERIMSKQLLRSGTSIGANVRESINAESPQDFIHKLSIAQKECDETLYWLELLVQKDYIEQDVYNSIHNEGEELLKIIRSIIITTKRKINS